LPAAASRRDLLQSKSHTLGKTMRLEIR